MKELLTIILAVALTTDLFIIHDMIISDSISWELGGINIDIAIQQVMNQLEYLDVQLDVIEGLQQ